MPIRDGDPTYAAVDAVCFRLETATAVAMRQAWDDSLELAARSAWATC